MNGNDIIIKVIGVGGGGINAINHMVNSNVRGADFIAINTDSQSLETSPASKHILIGAKRTGGRGAGADPNVGREAAEEDIQQIKEVVNGADMIFITAGMGGGTGTGAASVVAKAAREAGALTVGIVTKPFPFEGRRRMLAADKGIEELSKNVDSLIVIPNERLNLISETRISLANAFKVADDVLRTGVQSISEVINVPGYVNLDFADVTAVMKDAGYAHMGIGSASGPDKAKIAATAAVSSPLLETTIAGAMGVLISITASPDLSLSDIELASTMISEQAHPDANIIWGAAFDPALEDAMNITIVATGFEGAKKVIAPPAEDEAKPVAEEKITQPSLNDKAPTRASTPLSNEEFTSILRGRR